MKALRNFSRVLIGLVFIYSGFVKVVDPLGSAYKFNDYFTAMNLEFLSGMALTFAILMSAAELLIGIALLFNLLPKISSWASLLFMAMFTPVTLWLAIANPVSDCGCFGDALILTNWETFFKNVVIDVFVVIIFLQRKKFQPLYSLFIQWVIGLVFITSVFVLELYCINNLPIVDFRPYHIGANISEGMVVPDEEKDNIDVYESVFIYEKNGEQKEFLAESLPDSTWTFVDAEHKLVEEGYVPPIHDFTIEPVYLTGISQEPQDEVYVNLYDAELVYEKDGETEFFTVDMLPDSSWNYQELIYEEDLEVEKIDLVYMSPDGSEESFTLHDRPDESYIFIDALYESDAPVNLIPYGEDIADIVLADSNYFFIMVSTHIEDAKTENLEKINNIAAFCEQESYNFYCLTASTEEDIIEFIDSNDPIYNFYNTDPITLKTIVRSNPGLLLLRNGTVIDKWSSKNIPEVEELQKDLAGLSITEQKSKSENKLAIILTLAMFLFMSLFHNLWSWLLRNKYVNKR